jgi:AcrR family transcriptional regulator
LPFIVRELARDRQEPVPIEACERNRMSRRERTERQILEAFEAQLKEGGMASLGINKVAERAGVSKELIYRYFDGMPGLMLAWMQEQDFWTSQGGMLLDEAASRKPPAELVLSMLRAQVEALASNEALREVRRWELVERNDVSARLAQRRERLARKFIDRIEGVSTGMDVPAVVSVMLAGVIYLSLRAKTESEFLGVALRTEAGWDRIDAALEHIATSFPEAMKTQPLEALERLAGEGKPADGAR